MTFDRGDHGLERGSEQVRIYQSGVLLAHVQTQTFLLELIKISQDKDAKLLRIKDEISIGKHAGFGVDTEGILRYSNRICVPDVDDLRRTILMEALIPTFSRLGRWIRDRR